MYPLFESIKLKDGFIHYLEYHQQRMNYSQKELFPQATPIDLAKELSAIEMNPLGTFKIRVLYGSKIERIEIDPYILRSIKSLQVVYDDDIDYHLKFADRQSLNGLYARRGACGDIIIVKDGYVTDSYYANLLFFDGQRWITSQSPLLKGTKRQYLLDNGLIFEEEIQAIDIPKFQKVGIINAMIDLDEMPIIQMEDIHF